ncbi:protein phosphatase Slingshot homolog 3 isoform X3 [Coturnix japonica]|uniref:protein phosphatase Slingshot homolog 3 isoform X3 n=1 Tax=Coturnix japonica TaxID=93934 RepID=UPI0013A5F262|nr:protein phosphatase Slingshot homolog 3 isoform X3 [Coturnix japonica]
MYMDVYRALSTAECGLCLGRGGGQGLREGAVTGRKGSPGVRPSPSPKFCPVPLSRPAGGSPDVGRGGAVPAAPPGPFRARCGRGRRGASWTGHGVGHRAEGAGLLRGSPRGRRCAQARPPAAASFALVRGAALLLPAKEPPASGPAPAATPGRQERHLQLMMRLLRAQDAIQLAVRLEAARPQWVRYLLVVRPEEVGAEGQTALLGVDFTHEGADHCTLGMVLPLWSDTQVFLDGDGGFSVTSGGQTRIFKPISIQTMWAVLQELHRACELAAQGGHIPGGPALSWAQEYAAVLDSEQSCLNEWLAMADLESVRPGSPLPTEPTERVVRALLQDVLTSADLESITSKEESHHCPLPLGECQVRTELERRVGHSLEQHKDFIDNEMLLVLAQMDRPSRVFPHIYLGSEWNAANLEELQQNCVTHILNVAREVDNFFPALFNYMNVRVYDEETAQLLPHWNDTFLFLSDIKAKGGRALVHCKMGVSRSASTVMAYAMKEFGWSLERALRHVRRCRPDVQPNPGFMRQLDFYQGILNASRHSSFWEPQAAERSPEPEEAVPWDEADLPPSPPASSPPPEEDGRPRLVGVSRRPRISLCAVMRSISQMEAPENLGEPPGGEVSKGDRGAGDGASVEAAPPGARPRSRPCRVVRQASVDGDRDPAEDNGP